MPARARTRRLLGMDVLPLWPLAWPLFFVALLSYVGLAGCFAASRETMAARTAVLSICLFLMHPAALSVIAALWLGMDCWLIYRVRRCWRSDGEPARPLKLFFLWQVTKIAFCLIYPALVYAYFRP